MRLPDKAIAQFRQLWREEYGEDIPLEEARANAERLLSVLRVTMSPPSPNNNGPP